MELSVKQKNVYAEAYTLLGYLDQDDFNKIPKDIIKVIEQNRNRAYAYKIDENIELKNQKMMPETKALIFNILTRYVLSIDEKNIMMEKQRKNELKTEMQKIERYNPENLFKNDNIKDNITESVNCGYNENKPLFSDEKHTNFFKKILYKIKEIFK